MDAQNNQIVIIFLVSTLFVLLLTILVVLFLVVYQKRIVKQEMRLQKMEHNRTQLLLKATIEGQERERRRLAKELHDGIGSLLAGLSLNLKYEKDKRVNSVGQSEFLIQACDMLDEGIVNIRQISHDLMPVTLETFGIVSAIKECAQPLDKFNDLKIDLDLQIVNFRLENEIELGILRIFQELLQNTIKHANANLISVNLSYKQNQLYFNYKDNGRGFVIGERTINGIGIRNMESRVKALGGTIDFISHDNKGLQTAVKLPFNNKKEN